MFIQFPIVPGTPSQSRYGSACWR